MSEFEKNKLVNAITRAVINEVSNHIKKVVIEKINENPVLRELFRKRGL